MATTTNARACFQLNRRASETLHQRDQCRTTKHHDDRDANPMLVL